jgi:hypothetical protein
LYPKIPTWFAKYDVPAAMYVPNPGVVAYRGKALLNNDSLHWAEFRTEWTVNVFARWVDDAHYRGLLWHVLLARRGDSFEILGPFEVKKDSSAVGAYSDEMTIPDSPEYDYSARDPVLVRLQVPRVPVAVNGVEMAGSELPRRSVGRGLAEARCGAAAPAGQSSEWGREPRRDLVDTGVTGMRLPAATVRKL